MLNRRTIVLAGLMGLILSGMACADMMPANRTDIESDQSQYESTQGSVSLICDPLTCNLAIETEEETVDFDKDQKSQGAKYQIEEPSSFELCVYGLLGIGFCHCRPWIKRVSLGITPEWYHDGGLQQVRHSYAVLPGSQYSQQAYCFIQPAINVKPPILQLYQGGRPLFLQKTQTTLFHLIPRGPPV